MQGREIRRALMRTVSMRIAGLFHLSHRAICGGAKPNHRPVCGGAASLLLLRLRALTLHLNTCEPGAALVQLPHAQQTMRARESFATIGDPVRPALRKRDNDKITTYLGAVLLSGVSDEHVR